MDADLSGSAMDDVRQAAACRVSHRDMCDQSIAEKGTIPCNSAIDVLIDQDKGAGREPFVERADRADRQDVGDTRPFECIDIGTVIDAVR